MCITTRQPATRWAHRLVNATEVSWVRFETNATLACSANKRDKKHQTRCISREGRLSSLQGNVLGNPPFAVILKCIFQLATIPPYQTTHMLLQTHANIPQFLYI